MKILTIDEHKNYVHPCRLSGEQLEENDICDSCPEGTKILCFNSHAVIGSDAEQRLMVKYIG